MTTTPLRGLANARYHADDLEAAARWYAAFLGLEPYFRRPGYVEFRLGDHQTELGIVDRRYLGQLGGAGGPVHPGGVVAYWHVDDVMATWARLLELGATAHEAPRDFGRGFIGAVVLDPFGNLLGVMQNPHYLEQLAAR